jgi:predicted phage tail protein
MTRVKLHGILGKEYGRDFRLQIGNPKNILHAIDANRDGFLPRIVQLQKEGLVYEIIINKKRLNDHGNLKNLDNVETIDLVPAIVGGGPLVPIIGWLVGGTFLANVALAVIFAAITYALTPAPDTEQVEGTASASKSSMIFGNNVNTANQGAPLPLGYGRLKVGSQVIQATIKSYPQHTQTKGVLTPRDDAQSNTSQM